MQSLLPASLHNCILEVFPWEDLWRRNLSFELFRWGLFGLSEIRQYRITVHQRIYGLLRTLEFIFNFKYFVVLFSATFLKICLTLVNLIHHSICGLKLNLYICVIIMFILKLIGVCSCFFNSLSVWHFFDFYSKYSINAFWYTCTC